MLIALKTDDGKNLDTKNVKFMTLDNTEYAMFPVLKTEKLLPAKPQKWSVDYPEDAAQERVSNALEDLILGKLGSKGAGRGRGVRYGSVAHKVRQWIDSAKPGDSTTFASPSDCAIRVACETKGVKAKIFKIKRGQYNVMYERDKKYARSVGT